MAVRVGYLDAALDLEGLEGAASQDPSPSPDRLSMTNRRIAAEGSYESMVWAGHRLHVDVRASRSDLPAPAATGWEEGRFAGVTGWGVRLGAGDEWRVSTPLTVTYGLGYDRGIDGNRPTLIEPRVGGTWSAGGFSSGLTLEYNLLSEGGLPIAWGRGSSGGTGALGFDARAEARVPFGLRLRGEIARDPASIDPQDAADSLLAPARDPLYVAGSAVATGRDSLGLEHQSASVVTWVEWARGSAEGLLAQIFPIEVPAQLLTERRVDWHGGTVGVRVAATGTDVRAEYRRVEDAVRSDRNAPGDAVRQEYIEVRLSQDVLRAEGRGMACRLLVAARTSPYRVSRGPGETATVADATFGALGRRVSAGLSVAF